MKTKSIKEINQTIKKGKAVVMTAEEIVEFSKDKSTAEVFEKVDVVTTATFAPMCSSGAFINFGHSDPPIRMESATLDNVRICTGIAAVDAYIGATEESPENPEFGGAHVIEKLVRGEKIHLKATAKGTDCYPRKSIETYITKDDVNEIIMFNPRNAYQNYCVAVNSSKSTKYTYMGTLLPNFSNANFSTSGELSPLINDPDFETIGIGSKIFLCGAEGYIAWNGTQFHTGKSRNISGIPLSNAATLAVVGDLKEMSPDFIKAAYYEKYGVSIFIGIGIPIPLINESITKKVCISNKEIETSVVDYADPAHPVLGTVNYEQLFSGEIHLQEQRIKTAPMSSLPKARIIASELGKRIENGQFLLTEPVQQFKACNALKSLKVK
jgi:uncharacterized protein (DUF39 family)